MIFGFNEIVGIITILMVIGTYLPYLYEVIKGQVKPHPFTWIIWMTLTGIAYIAQIYGGAGPGAWMTGFVLFITIFVIIFSVKNGFSNIKKLDYIVLGIGGFSIILWVITNDPTYSIILVSFANTIAYVPTFRKSYYKPHDEAVYLFGVNAARHGLSIMALANFSLVTALFPAILVFNNLVLTLFLLWRRWKID